MASQPQVTSWLTENGPKELELLFRAIVFHPSAPILLADNERRYREASVGASKLWASRGKRSSAAVWMISRRRKSSR